MPDFVKAYNANKDTFIVIGVNMADAPDEVQQFVKEQKVTYPITIDDTGDLTLLFRVRGHPTNVFIDRNGVISLIVPGMVTPQMLDEQLKLLAK